MTDFDRASDTIDGRAARRQRNIDAVLDVVLEMFAEEAMFPTMEQAATRSGLSLRSLYRYFADPADLIEAAIKRMRTIARELSQLHDVGRGPLERRIEDFVSMRLRLHDEVGPVFRASVANSAHHARVRDRLSQDRVDMRAQFELQFAPELAARTGGDREVVSSAGDLLTQLESVDYLRRHRRLAAAEAHAVLSTALHSLLAQDG